MYVRIILVMHVTVAPAAAGRTYEEATAVEREKAMDLLQTLDGPCECKLAAVAMKAIRAADSGTTPYAPTESFIERLLDIMRVQGGLTPDQVSEELEYYRSTFEDMRKASREFIARYGA